MSRSSFPTLKTFWISNEILSPVYSSRNYYLFPFHFSLVVLDLYMDNFYIVLFSTTNNILCIISAIYDVVSNMQLILSMYLQRVQCLSSSSPIGWLEAARHSSHASLLFNSQFIMMWSSYRQWFTAVMCVHISQWLSLIHIFPWMFSKIGCFICLYSSNVL